MSKVIQLVKGDDKEANSKADMLSVSDNFRKKIEKGEIDEFIIVSVSPHGEVRLHAYFQDFLAAIGLLEVGKATLVNRNEE